MKKEIVLARENLMGWKSTENVTREWVRQQISEQIDDATDEQLEDILETLTPNSGSNYCIIDRRENEQAADG